MVTQPTEASVQGGSEAEARRAEPAVILALGRLRVSTKDAHLTFACDALAFDPNRTVVLLSVAGNSVAIKALRATLQGNNVGRVQLDYHVEDDGQIISRYLYKHQDADYHCEPPHKLGVNAWQFMVWVDDPRLLRCSSDEALWQALQRGEYTTPLLRAWVPYLAQRCREQKYLLAAESYGCQVSYLKLTSDQLDELVVAGVRQGHLQIKRS